MIWLLWNNNVELIVNFKNHDSFIHFLIRDNIKDTHWLATFFYLYPEYHFQKYLWKKILNLNLSSTQSSMIIGDNKLSFSQEKFVNNKGYSINLLSLEKTLDEN